MTLQANALDTRYMKTDAAQKKLAEVKKKYSRKGFEISLGNGKEFIYLSKDTDPCPFCGGYAEIQPYVTADERREGKRDGLFVAMCANCGARAEGEWSPEKCVEVWNAKKFTKETLILSKKLDHVDEDAARNFCRTVLASACQDAIEWVRKKWLLEIAVATETDPEKVAKAEAKLVEVRKNLHETGAYLKDRDMPKLLDLILKTLYPDSDFKDREKMTRELANLEPWSYDMRKGAEIKEEQMQVRRKRYFTDYVNHMIRFFISTPETLDVAGKKRVDIDNWLCVQSIWCGLENDEKDLLRTLYSNTTEGIENLVRAWSCGHAVPIDDVWKKVYSITREIAAARGLI